MPILTPEERIGSYVAGRYRLDSILGVGGMGVVYVGTHTWTDRRVAVKVLAPEYARNETVVQRFLQEARTAASLRHPSVVDVLDMGEDADGTVFLVLELLEGEPLTELIEREGPLPPERTLDLLLPVMRALVAAHRRNIVHRDIKPDNIFVARDESGQVTPKILDFGIAKVIESANSATATGSVIGTPYYMSPEQAAGAPDVGPASDVWSMGVVLYECLSNHLPFMGPNPTAVLLAIASGDAPPLSAMSSSVPEPLAEVVDHALVHDRKLRYQNMGDLIEALVAAANAAGVKVRARGAAHPAQASDSAGRTQAFDPGAPTLTPSNAPATGAQTTGSGRGQDAASNTYADFLARSQGALRAHKRGVRGVIGAAAVGALAIWGVMASLGDEPGGAAAPAETVAGDPPPVAGDAPPEETGADGTEMASAEPADGPATDGAGEPAGTEGGASDPGAETGADGADEAEAGEGAQAEDEELAEGVEMAPWEKRAEARKEAERAERLRRLRERRRRLAAQRRAERRRAREKKKREESKRSGSLMREW